MGQTTLDKVKAAQNMSWIFMRARLRYKSVDYLGTLTSYAHLCLPLYAPSYKPYLRVRAVLLHSSGTYPVSVSFLQR